MSWDFNKWTFRESLCERKGSKMKLKDGKSDLHWKAYLYLWYRTLLFPSNQSNQRNKSSKRATSKENCITSQESAWLLNSWFQGTSPKEPYKEIRTTSENTRVIRKLHMYLFNSHRPSVAAHVHLRNHRLLSFTLVIPFGLPLYVALAYCLVAPSQERRQWPLVEE